MLLRRYVIPAVLKMLRDLLKNAGTFLTKGKDDYIRVAVQVHDHKELMMGAAAILEGHWAEGRFSQDFSERLAEKMGTRFCLLTNSGSSSNLLALTALTSPLLRGRRLKPGDEVVTVAAGFPTTVNPILQNGLTPVFVDVELGTYNTTLERVRDAIGPKTKAVMLAHALG
ncbi:MAG TPA: DegT/DnrJ/EryC1/StrS family aminotransferase, partial [bacterium]|nr:DegT/DnrJ/EryC1/StrS family aminotransferase [bacterium]